MRKKEPTRPFAGALASILVLTLAITAAAGARGSEVAADEPAVRELAAKGVKKHRKPRKPPIELGVSGGNVNDLDVGTVACVSNTLGGLVQGDAQYILSSNGTLARRNDAAKGEAVIQPGLRDTKRGSCNTENPKGHTVAELTKFKKLKLGRGKNQVDAALAEVRPGMVDPDGRVLGIGIPGSDVVEPFLGQQVRKSGRGTGVEEGTVTALNVSVDVDYLGPTVRFIKQFVVESNTGRELYVSGDSGSVFFENRDACPGWVGLSVAGSVPNGRLAFVSPMSTVLKQLAKRKPKGDLDPVGCGNGGAEREVRLSSRSRRDLRDAERIQRRLESAVLRLPGVVGMGIGLAKDDPEEVVFKILVEADTAALRAGLPERLGKVRYEILTTGSVRAM